MLGASFLPARFRGVNSNGVPSAPGYLNKQLSTLLQTLSRRSCTHPIHTIVFVMLLASTSYMGLLEGSIFGTVTLNSDSSRHADLKALVEGGRHLRLGDETAWKWQSELVDLKQLDPASQHHALVTLVFPNSLSHNSPQTAPTADLLPVPENSSVQPLPATANPFSPLSQDSTLAFSMLWQDTQAFLDGITELPEQSASSHGVQGRKWLIKPSKSIGNGSQSLRTWTLNAWSEFVDLLKNAQTLDILIMLLGYLSMHLTFVSLFMSMRRLGSNFWLGTTILFSSVFAFLFGLLVTTTLGVPINMVLLSEGLPFLVVTIGFEKPMILTKAVLSASWNTRPPGTRKASGDSEAISEGPTTVQSAVQSAVRAKGFEIVRDYVIEIAILIAGAASGVQGGLRQFCFLAAWVLFFDCILLFTFYTAILCVKLEINRIKRHVALRRALEEDGVSRRVAENVASSNDWPPLEGEGVGSDASGVRVFGRKVGDSSIPTFKVLMFGGFLLVNLVNLLTIPFRGGNKNATSVSGISGVLAPLPIDPFKVAENGLDRLHFLAASQHQPMVVTVLAPIKYELSSTIAGVKADAAASGFDFDLADQFMHVVGGRVIEGVLKSLDDPVLSKWIVAALTLSLVLNGYLFNAARWTIKDPRLPPAQSNLHHARTSSSRGRSPQHAGNVTDQSIDINSLPNDPGDSASGNEEKVNPRTKLECEQMAKAGRASELTDFEIIDLTVRGKIPGYALERSLDNPKQMTKLASLTRAVKIRRALVSRTAATSATSALLERSKLPYQNFNYENVHGACCENVIGYLPLPLGVAGPLVIDGQSYFLPMATTEGVLVASTNRGCKAINAGGGAVTILTGDGMTRGPCVGFSTLSRAGAAKLWLDSEEGQKTMKQAFNSTSRFARLQTMKTAMAGTYLYVRFKTTTGDAMGMNMISKGVECALNVMKESGFDDMAIISVSGNYCTDKKAAAINWIDGRGKSIVAEAIIPGDIVRSLLKSDVNALVELNTAKNLIGSAMAGSVGGFNAHASNIVAAMFLATGQDPAQVVESANCITVMKNYNGALQISVSMPCIEVGTIGGGTVLEPQQAMLDLLGVKGAHLTHPGDNARRLARIIGATVLAGELSLCSALAAGHLVRAHMAHNRSAVPTRSTTPVAGGVGIGMGTSDCLAGGVEKPSVGGGR